MKQTKFLSASISLLVLTAITLLVPSIGLSYPEGELYWATENYPDHTYPFDTGESYNGAVAAIDYACTQYPGVGVYQNEVRILDASYNFPAEKAGYCRIKPNYVPVQDGQLYYVYLYCNGVKRDQWDDYTPCETPGPTTDKNLGKRCQQDIPFFGNPINTGTGNKYHTETDFFPSAVPMALAFTRYYNSQAENNDSMGYGWSHSYSMRLEFSGGRIIAWRSDGRAIYFDNTTFAAESGEKEQLEQDGSNYRLTTPGQQEELYNASGQLISQSDRNNNSRTVSYTSGNLTTVTGPFGRTLVLAYNGDNKISSITDAAGKTVFYSYDTNANLSSVTWPDGSSSVRQYHYEDTNDIHNLTGITDENTNRFSTYIYDSQGRATMSTRAGNAGKITVAYDVGGDSDAIEISDSRGSVTSVSRTLHQGIALTGTAAGPTGGSGGTTSRENTFDNTTLNLTETKNSNNVSTLFSSYDSWGNAGTITYASGTTEEKTITRTFDTTLNRITGYTGPSSNSGQNKTASWQYDSYGNLTKGTLQGYAGTTTITAITDYTWNSHGQLTEIDGPRTGVNDETSFTYSGTTGNLLTVATPAGTTTYSQHDASGRPGKTTDPNGLETLLTYTFRGQLLTVNSGGLFTSYEYYPDGLLKKTTRPSQTLTYSYDSAHRLIEIEDGLGNIQEFTLDTEGNETAIRYLDSADQQTRTLSRSYYPNNRLESVTELTGITSYLYDNVGNITTVRNPLNDEVGYLFDSLNRLTKITRPAPKNGDSNPIIQYGYDSAGNLNKITDPENHVTNYSKDDFNNTIETVSADTGTTVGSYDPAGNLVSSTDSNGITTGYAYDGLNRPVSVDFPGSPSAIILSYDQGTNGKGHLTGIQDTAGSTSYSYNLHGRVSGESRTIDGHSYTTSYSYNSTAGSLASIAYPGTGNMTLSMTRDGNGQISSLTVDGTPLLDTISRLPFGPLKTASLTGSFNLTRSHDQRYNVSRIQAGTLDYQYIRDKKGRVISLSGTSLPKVSNAVTSFTYRTGSNVLESGTGHNAKQYTTDNHGNIISDGTRQFIYDPLNRLIEVKENSQTIATYGYDAHHRRVKKTVNSITTHFHYDLDSRLIAETTSDGTPVRSYIYLDDMPIAMKKYGSNAGIYYFINDHLGTPQQLVNSSGAVVWKAKYFPFGKAQLEIDTVSNNLRFPGQYFDAETGLHYNWHRYYDPDTKRYFTADPIGLAGGINLYVYVNGNPVNYTDPEGLICGTGVCVGGAIIAGGGMSGEAVAGAITGIALAVGIGEILDKCKDEPCPPCRLVDGTVVAVGTMAYRYDKVPPSRPHHPYTGDHVHLSIAQKNPNNCRCFWKKTGVQKPPPPVGAIPIQNFAN